MSTTLQSMDVENKIITLRNQSVILDSDVAELYGVETKRINEAVKNNSDKFPEGYILELDETDWQRVRSKFSTSPLGGGRAYIPKAFTEKGLYMLATILKSAKATATTLSIVETFTKVREAARMLQELPKLQQDSPHSQAIVEKTGDLLTDLIMPEDLTTTESEASIELNLAMVKVKYSVKKKEVIGRTPTG